MVKIYRKVFHIEENHDEGTNTSVPNNESLLYIGFVIKREFVGGLAESKAPDIFLLYRKILYSQI